MSEELNLTIKQGETWGVSWPVVDQNQNPVDLTGWLVRSQVRPSVNAEQVLHEWSSTLGNVDTANAHVTMRVPAEVSSEWTWSSGVYDVELTSPNGTVTRVAEGYVIVSREVTR